MGTSQEPSKGPGGDDGLHLWIGPGVGTSQKWVTHWVQLILSALILLALFKLSPKVQILKVFFFMRLHCVPLSVEA